MKKTTQEKVELFGWAGFIFVIVVTMLSCFVFSSAMGGYVIR
jgi:uncharacterized membrane protein